MKKLMVCLMIMASLMLSLISLAQAHPSTLMVCEGNGYFYASIAGSGSTATLQWDMMGTPYGKDMDPSYIIRSIRDDFLTIDGSGGSYMGMQYANSLTVDRIIIVNNGTVESTQSYFDRSGDLGYFGTFLGTRGMGILYTSGFFSGALADSNFSISQYAGKYNPDINTSLTMAPLNSAAEGQGCSQMLVALYDDWIYSPSTGIFDYWQDSWMSGVTTTGYLTLQLTVDDGLPVDISSTWTVPLIDIEVYTEL